MIAGITGHRDLGDAASWVRQALAEQIAQQNVALGLTSLAIGTDQLFADVLLEKGIPFEAVLPSDKYESTFASTAERARFHHLLSRASHVERLRYSKPTEESFFAAGREIVNRAELLIAVWDGEPARGLGGTGDVVAYAQSLGRAWIHIDPQQRLVLPSCLP